MTVQFYAEKLAENIVENETVTLPRAISNILILNR